MRLLACSFVCCVLATGAWAQWYGGNPNVTVVYPQPTQSPSVVVIVGAPRAAVLAERKEQYVPARQITYLIAFKSGVIRAADQYWVDGSTLYYLTLDHQRKAAPVDNVDRTLSERLNSEQNVAFYLPAEQRKAGARLAVLRRTASSARRRRYCEPR